MRILLAADQYPEFHNGAGAATERLAAGLAGRGHAVTVVYPSADGPSYGDLAGRGDQQGSMRYERLASVRLPHGQGVRICLPGSAALDAAAILASAAYDVVHVQSHLPVGRAFVHAARRATVPVVATNHFMPENLLPHIPAPDAIRRRLGRWAWRDLARVFGQSDLITTPTARAAELLAARTGLPLATPISNGIDLELFRPVAGARREYDPFVLFVGRLEEEKRVVDLLRAFAEVPDQGTSRLVYIGNGSLLHHLQGLATEYGIADRVEFWGNVPNDRLRQAYTECAVFCAPGIAELQSLVTLEAIASGAPVVAADAVALPHLVHHGRNGFRYDPDHPDQLTGHLTNLLANPGLRQRMGAESRLIALTHDFDLTLDAYETCYLQVMSRGQLQPRVPAEALAA